MFVRIKSIPNSPHKSVQLVESVRNGDKVRQRIVRHIRIAMDDNELIKLKQVGEYVKAKLESQHQASLFYPGQVAREVAASKEEKTTRPKNTALNIDPGQLREEQHIITGIHETYGHLFDELGFGTAISPPVRYQSALDIFRHIVMARIANPESKRASVNLLEQDFGVSLSLDKVYRMMDKGSIACWL